MSREWKPGDVAAIGTSIAFRTEGGWAYRDGSVGRLHQDRYAFRPLAVIDYEDAEQVERLRKIVAANGCLAINRTEEMQDALREFASPTPPKPDEPTGLGAVVEDAEGKRYVRADDPPDVDWNLDKPWRHGAGWSIRSHWQIVPAVRVLSEGVQP